MSITGLAVGFIIIYVGIWRYYHCKNRTGKTISVCIIIAGVLVISDAVNYKGNPYQEGLGKYYSEECQSLVLSGGNADGEINIIK